MGGRSDAVQRMWQCSRDACSGLPAAAGKQASRQAGRLSFGDAKSALARVLHQTPSYLESFENERLGLLGLGHDLGLGRPLGLVKVVWVVGDVIAAVAARCPSGLQL